MSSASSVRPSAAVAALRTAEGAAALARAGGLTGGDRLTAVAALRAEGHSADVVAVDADPISLARAGLAVYAVDADPDAVAVACANAAALGLADRITVECADAVDVDLAGFDAVFCDPARRSGGRRIFDPAGYAPPWEFLAALPHRVPRTVLKLGPGIDHALIPPDAEAEWISVAGDVVEAALWHGPLAAVPRRAVVIGERVDELTGSGHRRGAVGPVRDVLYDPDGAVVRAHLVAEFADRLDATLLDPAIAYLTADTPRPTRFARAYAVREVLPFSLKRLRAALRSRRVGRVTIKKRGSALEPERLRRDLRLAGDEEATVVLTRITGRPYALLVDPLR